MQSTNLPKLRQSATSSSFYPKGNFQGSFISNVVEGEDKESNSVFSKKNLFSFEHSLKALNFNNGNAEREFDEIDRKILKGEDHVNWKRTKNTLSK